MSRHDPIVALRHMLDHAREAAAMVEGRARAQLDGDRQLSLVYCSHTGRAIPDCHFPAAGL